MARQTQVLGDFTFELQNALSAYSDEMYTNAKKLSGTGIVGSNAQIDPSTETFIGQTRFFKPYSSQTVNVASVTNSANGSQQSYTSDYMTYVKTVRTHGAKEINVQRVVSEKDALAKIARDFAEVRSQDEHDAILSVLRGVASSETNDTEGYNDFGLAYTQEDDANFKPDSEGVRGFYVDMNAAGAFGSAVSSADNARGLITANNASIYGDSGAGYGAVRAENLFVALALGFADYEPDYVYMVTSPEVMSQLRSANLVDQTTVTEGNLTFQTAFGGKFRLIMTRADQGNLSGKTPVNNFSTKTTFFVKPGAIEMAMLDVPMPVEMYRDANTYNGSGSTDIWYRWGYVAHAMGYEWTGSTTEFATNSAYNAHASWKRKSDVLNLGILPVLHA